MWAFGIRGRSARPPLHGDLRGEQLSPLCIPGGPFAQVQGYDTYAQKAAIAKQSGLGGAIDGFMQAAIWGNSERILRALEARREVVGDFELNVAFRFGGVPSAIAERGLRLFAREVLPVLQTWTAVEVAEAAP